MFDLETLELLITVLASAVTNYIFIRERLLVLETKFQYTRETVEDLSKTLRKMEQRASRLEVEKKGA